jgi:D-alanyl-D-alanine carboxypeptidase
VVAAASGEGVDAAVRDVRPWTPFRLASLTKLFTASVVLQLAQEGRLALDDPIARWVAFPRGDEVTVAMLLSHTGGVPNLPEDLGDRDWTPQELIDRVAARGELDYAPGKSWAYSNTGYLLLGQIAERASGRRWHEEVRSRIAEPLGLSTLYAYGLEPGPEPIAGYALRCAGEDGAVAGDIACIGRPSSAVVVEHAHDWRFAWSAGSLVASAPDVARFLHALIEGDLLEPAYRERMLTPVPATAQRIAEAYAKAGARPLVLGVGLGPWLYDVDGVGRGWGHAGSIDGFNDTAVYYPDLGFGAVVLNDLLPAGTDPYAPGTALVGRAGASILGRRASP